MSCALHAFVKSTPAGRLSERSRDDLEPIWALHEAWHTACTSAAALGARAELAVSPAGHLSGTMSAEITATCVCVVALRGSSSRRVERSQRARRSPCTPAARAPSHAAAAASVWRSGEAGAVGAVCCREIRRLVSRAEILCCDGCRRRRKQQRQRRAGGGGERQWPAASGAASSSSCPC